MLDLNLGVRALVYVIALPKARKLSVMSASSGDRRRFASQNVHHDSRVHKACATNHSRPQRQHTSTTMSTRSAVKRKRIESTEENSVPIVRSKVWYDDGNVVLEAQGAHFKVHRGLLSESSSVFRDMFTIPQPPSSPTEEIVDGCPVIHLSDSRLYLEYVLEALFQRKCVTVS